MISRTDIKLCVLLIILLAGLSYVDSSRYSVVLLGMELQTDNNTNNQYEFLMINLENFEIRVEITRLCNVESSRYSVVLLGMELQTDNNTNNQYEFLMINLENFEIRVEITNIESTVANIVIPAQQYGDTMLPASYGMNGTEYANKTLLVASNGTFKLQVFSVTPSHTEGFLPIPLNDLNGPNLDQVVYEYIVATFCGTSGYCQMGVASFEDAEVKFTFPAHAGEVSFCYGYLESYKFQVDSDKPFLIKKYHAIQIETTRDLTGTHIYSFKPIVVMVGSRNITVANGVAHTLEQLVPSSQWGTKFATAPFIVTDFGDIVKISASWPNTEVNMTGFNGFIITEKENVVTRRLEKESATYITASAPIQVVQITGLDYATYDNTLRVAMVTVPAVEHFASGTKTSCGITSKSGTLIVPSEKSIAPSVLGLTFTDDLGIPFTKYKISRKYVTSEDVYEVSSVRPVGGVMVCENGALVSMVATHNNNSQTQTQTGNNDLPFDETTCLDGIEGWASEFAGDKAAIFSHTFDGYTVLKLRTITCGDVDVTFYTDGGYLVYRLSRNKVFVTDCLYDQNHCDHLMFDDSYNVDRDCERDMAWYWFRVVYQPQETRICFGYGPIFTTDDKCTFPEHVQVNMLEYGNLDIYFTHFTITPIFGPVYFNYDLQPDAPCLAHVADWRCQDKVHNCSSYGTDFCEDQTYTELSENGCPKYCNKCYPDSYGQKFVFPVTEPDTEMLIHVTSNELETQIGVAGHEYVIPRTGVNGKTREYDLQATPGMIWIISNKDVAVSVVYLDNGIQGTNLFPVDSFSTEYFLLPECPAGDCTCSILTEIPADVTIFITDQVGFSETDATSFSVMPFEVYEIQETQAGGIANGTKLVSTGPIGVFCGSVIPKDKYTQMMPTAKYGTEYNLPALDFSHEFLTNIELVIKAIHYNTEVDISNSVSDSNEILETIGQTVTVAVDTKSAYMIESNFPIMVVLRFSVGGQTQHVPVPPVNCFYSGLPLFAAFNYQVRTSYISDTGVTSNFTNKPTEHAHEITDDSFGVVMWYTDSKAMFLGSYMAMNPFQNLNGFCSTSTGTLSDNQDNDCDGHTDEDTCTNMYGVYGIDGDLDGDFGGDCGELKTEPVIVELSPLVCRYIEKRYNRCWTAWKCPCSWVNNLQNKTQMTDKEFFMYQSEKQKTLESKLLIATKNLTAVKSQKMSAEDERVSAARMGYVGITLFVLVFGLIFVLDLGSIYRDIKIIRGNLRAGLNRICGRKKTRRKVENVEIELSDRVAE